MVKWIPPLMGWAKLNTDGSFIGNTWMAREGESFRTLGVWIGGYSQTISITTSVQTKLKALKDNLLFGF
jgi:hypothetical protein